MQHGLNPYIVGLIGGNGQPGPISVESYEGINSIYTVPGHHELPIVHIDLQEVTGLTAAMVIDLSDTVNWPHDETGHIDLEFLNISINPNTSYEGDIKVGFLSNVDATNGDLNIIFNWHMQRVSSALVDTLSFGQGGHMELTLGKWFGPTEADNTLWQTDVNLVGPDGNTSYPSGDGDFVLKIEATAGAVDVGLTCGYHGEGT
jgi:hypothetical protein